MRADFSGSSVNRSVRITAWMGSVTTSPAFVRGAGPAIQAHCAAQVGKTALLVFLSLRHRSSDAAIAAV